MGTEHEWARDWFGTKRPPKPEDLQEGPSGPPQLYSVQLFYERAPRLDPEVLLAQLQKNCGTVERNESSDSSDPRPADRFFRFEFHDFKARMKLFLQREPHPDEEVLEGGEMPFHCTITGPGPALEDLETSLSQTRDWPEARAVLSTCKAMIVVSDMLANWHDHRVRLTVFEKVVRTLLEMTPCAAIHWIPSLCVVRPEHFLLAQQPGPSYCPTYGAVNVRVFHVEGGVPGEFCMDTMGLPDVQFHGSGCDPTDVADALHNIADLIFETGAIPPEGPPVESPRYPGLWCQAATAMMPPLRAAVSVKPSEQLVADWLAHRQAQGRYSISYFRVENGTSYHGTISDLDGVAKATWSYDEEGRRVTRDLPIDQDTFAFLCRSTLEFEVFQRYMIRDQDTRMAPLNYHCIVLEEGPGRNGFMVPADEADPDFTRWLKALNVPRQARASGPSPPGRLRDAG